MTSTVAGWLGPEPFYDNSSWTPGPFSQRVVPIGPWYLNRWWGCWCRRVKYGDVIAIRMGPEV